jgi:hypothetical protein
MPQLSVEVEPPSQEGRRLPTLFPPTSRHSSNTSRSSLGLFHLTEAEFDSDDSLSDILSPQNHHHNNVYNLMRTSITLSGISKKNRSVVTQKEKRTEDIFFKSIEKPPIEIRFKDLFENVIGSIHIPDKSESAAFKEYFCSEMSQKIISNLFWYVFCAFFQPNGLVSMQDIMEDLSKTSTQFFWFMKKEDRNSFFENYHLAVSFAINKALRKHFPGSKKRFTPNFKIRVFELVSEIVTGIRLRPSYLLRKKDKLFPRKKRDILEVLRREKEKMKNENVSRKKKKNAESPSAAEMAKSNKGFYSSSEEEEQGLEAEFNEIENFEDIMAPTKQLGANDIILLKYDKKKKDGKKIEEGDHEHEKEEDANKTNIAEAAMSFEAEKQQEGQPKEPPKKNDKEKEKQANVVEAMLKPSPRFESEVYRKALTQLLMTKQGRYVPTERRSRTSSRLSNREDEDAAMGDDEGESEQTKRSASNISDRDKRFWSTYSMSPLVGRHVPKPIEMKCSSNGRLIKRNGFQNPHFFGGSMDEKRRRKQIIEYNKKWINPPSMEHLQMSENMHQKWEDEITLAKTLKGAKPKKNYKEEEDELIKERLDILNDKTGVKINKLCSEMIAKHKEGAKTGQLETKYAKEEAHHFRGTTLAAYASETSQEVNKDIKKIDRLFEKLKIKY